VSPLWKSTLEESKMQRFFVLVSGLFAALFPVGRASNHSSLSNNSSLEITPFPPRASVTADEVSPTHEAAAPRLRMRWEFAPALSYGFAGQAMKEGTTHASL